jgi:tRNA A-37 threonylcarbamoyl transferase component Bud32
MTSISSSCPQCGAPLPADAPEQLCPACLMSKALPSNFDTVKLAAPPWSKGSSVRYMGDYELLEEIAQGGMGVVWKARQVKLDRTVAVKMVRGGALAGADDVQRFRAEAQAAANLKHPHIVGIHEVGEYEGQHYYSMDLIEGRPLSDLCHGTPMNAREAAELLQIVCDAVHFAHQRGILHRDLKPHNLMLDAEGKPHVLDFGLAKRIDDDQSLTMSGAVLGSPSYMAPEQAQGRNDRVGPHTDVYALGAILYQMLTGRAPFLANTAAETMMQVVQREPSAPSKFHHDIPFDLETICLKCLEKEPARRYATARELGEELARFLKGEPILAQPASAIRKAATWMRQHPGWLAGAVALVVLGLSCAVFWLYQENAWLQAKQRNPALERAPGGQTRALLQWFGMSALIVLTLSLWLNAWFMKHARRTTFRGLFDQGKFRPAFTVPRHVRLVQSLAGAACFGYGMFLIAKLIEAYVWEGGSPLPNRSGTVPSGYLFIAFVVGWIGLLMMFTAWRDHIRSVHGAPAHKIDDATTEAIGKAVAQGDFVGAMGLYRRAVPEAGLLEAREHVTSRVSEFRIADPAGYAEVYANPWRALRVQPTVLAAAVALVAAVWIMARPAEPAQVAWYFLGGALYGIVTMFIVRLRGFLIKLLAFLGCSALVFTGGTLIFEKELPGHVWLVFAGAVTVIVVLVVSQRPKTA